MWTSFNRCESWSSMNLMTSSSEVSSFHKKKHVINVCFCCSCLQTCSSIHVIQVVRPLWTPSSPLSFESPRLPCPGGIWHMFGFLTADAFASSPCWLLREHSSYTKVVVVMGLCVLEHLGSYFDVAAWGQVLQCFWDVILLSTASVNMFYGRVEIGFCLIAVALAEIFVFMYLWS